MVANAWDSGIDSEPRIGCGTAAKFGPIGPQQVSANHCISANRHRQRDDDELALPA